MTSALPWWRRPLSRRTTLSVWAFLGFMALWAFVVEPQRVVRVDHTWTAPAGWPRSCDGLRIVVVSDWHVGDIHTSPRRLARVFAKIKAAQPDLILMPGDFTAHVVGGQTLHMTDIARALAPASGIAPTFAVWGNHDLYDIKQSPAQMARALKSVGIVALNNQNTVIEAVPGCSLAIVGIGDRFSSQNNTDLALKGVTPGPALGLTHDARARHTVPRSQVPFLAAGHTHGGVLCLPLTHMCASKAMKESDGHTWGWYQAPDTADTLVTRGIGNSIVPIRFGAPPGFDVVVVTVPIQ